MTRRVSRWAWLFALTLLLAQGVGLGHRALHALGHAGAISSADLHDHAAADDHGFGHAAGDEQCRLLDQLALGDLVPPATPVLPVPVPAAFEGRLDGRTSDRAARRSFDARAPPPAIG